MSEPSVLSVLLGFVFLVGVVAMFTAILVYFDDERDW